MTTMPAVAKAKAPLSISEILRTSGVYEIRCLPNGKFYIGSATNLREQWREHRWGLRKGKHYNIYLQTAWDNYGEESFVFSVLELVEELDLLHVEQLWMDRTD